MIPTDGWIHACVKQKSAFSGAADIDFGDFQKKT